MDSEEKVTLATIIIATSTEKNKQKKKHFLKKSKNVSRNFFLFL